LAAFLAGALPLAKGFLPLAQACFLANAAFSAGVNCFNAITILF
jgi:hypothetical protein